jgi:vanillate O-demethylase ferredoxin subunit
MAFRPQLDPVLYAGLLRVPACSAPLPPSRLVAAARKANPGTGELSAIRMYADPEASTRIRFGDGRWVYVEPCTARVLGIQAAYGGLFGTLAWLHIFAYLPAGGAVAGSVALSALALTIAGLWLWWRARRAAVPRHRRSVSGPARLAGGARRLQRHRSVAPWAAPVLIVLALTGLPQAFPVLADALQSAGTASHPPPSHASSTGILREQSGVLDEVWRQVAAAPWQQMQWRIRAGPGDAITVELTTVGAPSAYAADVTLFSPDTGALLGQTRYEQASAGRKAWLWALALHYGAAGGPAWQLTLFLAALAVPVLAWTGVASYLQGRRHRRPARMLEVRLRSKHEEANGVCSFEFVHPRGRKLPPWTAGSHIDVHIAPGLVRQYSLCGDPRDRSRYLIAVHRCTPSRGGSRAMHDAVREGDRVQLGLPRNHFPLAPRARHSVLLAGGIGITPILGMAEALAAAGASFELHYCARSDGHAAFLARLGESRFKGRVQRYFSSDGQRVDFDRLLSAPQPETHLYVCGPAAFTDAAIAAAARQGWPDTSVHTERFAPAAPAGGADPLGAPFELVIASTGQQVQVPAGCTALDALLAAGISIPTSCGQGICGTCVTGVLDGHPEHRDHCLSPETRAANDCFTPCCSRARGPQLVLDL